MKRLLISMSKGLNIRVDDDVHKIIKDYQEREGIESRDETVERIVREWKKLRK